MWQGSMQWGKWYLGTLGRPHHMTHWFKVSACDVNGVWCERAVGAMIIVLIKHRMYHFCGDDVNVLLSAPEPVVWMLVPSMSMYTNHASIFHCGRYADIIPIYRTRVWYAARGHVVLTAWCDDNGNVQVIHMPADASHVEGPLLWYKYVLIKLWHLFADKFFAEQYVLLPHASHLYMYCF